MMGRQKKENLKPLAISKIERPGLHFVGHVSGLALKVTKSGSRSWILRISIAGKRRDIGLGPFPATPFQVAKEEALNKHYEVRNGKNPIDERKKAQVALKVEEASFITFREAAEQYISKHKHGWKNETHAKQWPSSLEKHAYPIIGNLNTKDIALDHILKIIEPIWITRTETASRVRSRIEAILDWAKVRGARTGENPARWKGNLDTILPARGKVKKVKHHKAMDYDDIALFVPELAKREGNSIRALELCIYTACRSGEARKAVWSEFDLEKGIWTIPADRMKGGKEHRVPLHPKVIRILKKQPRLNTTDLIFPSKNGTPLSSMALLQILRRMEKDCTVHGFRSTFRDWAGETTAFPREVIEHALAHKLKDKTEAAYARGDLFLKRQQVMNAWTEFLSNPQPKPDLENIIPISNVA